MSPENSSENVVAKGFRGRARAALLRTPIRQCAFGAILALISVFSAGAFVLLFASPLPVPFELRSGVTHEEAKRLSIHEMEIAYQHRQEDLRRIEEWVRSPEYRRLLAKQYKVIFSVAAVSVLVFGLILLLPLSIKEATMVAAPIGVLGGLLLLS